MQVTYCSSTLGQRSFWPSYHLLLIENAFNVTGIELYNPDVIPEELFAPSLITNRSSIENSISCSNEV